MNYYNEWDKYAAAWLRELIKTGLIPPGDVDERSITEVKSDELAKYTQCHFFAGIGGWSLALRLAGWPDDEPVWTGSCPCQPFSKANKNGGGSGRKDERHLWPIWARLIRGRNPAIILGEQVEDAILHGWLDEVFDDLEAADYTCGAQILPANAFGADHERKRLYWFADSGCTGREGLEPQQFIPGIEKTPQSLSLDNFAHARRALDGDLGGLLPCDGLSLQMERNAIKGFGNAIVPEIAAQFIIAAEGARCDMLARAINLPGRMILD